MCHPRILYPVKVFNKKKVETKTSSDKQKPLGIYHHDTYTNGSTILFFQTQGKDPNRSPEIQERMENN